MKFVMSFLKLVLNTSIIFIVAADIADKDIKPNMDMHVDNNIEPILYKIEIYLDMETQYYSGKSDARIKIFRETQDIQIYSRALSVSAYKLTDNVRTIYPNNLIFDKSYITVRFNETLLPGEYIFSTHFSSYNKTSGILSTSYINEEGERRLLFVSRSPIVGARHIFPCFDKPTLPAKIKISICDTTNGSYYVLSNTALEKKGWIPNYYCREFETTRKMPPHLVGILVYDFNFDNQLNFTIRGRKGLMPYLKFANIVVESVTRYFQDDTDYSSHNLHVDLETYKYVVIPYSENILASWRLVFYSEGEVTHDEKFNSFHERIKVAHLVARGVTYQWVGNHVNPSWWSNMWLNEGITTLLAAEAVNKIFKESRIMDLFVVEFQQESFRLDTCLDICLDTDFVMKPLALYDNNNNISESSLIFPFSYYIKAPVILRMLQQLLTDEVFQKGIHIYMNNHKDSSASLDDFWKAMETAYSEVKEKHMKHTRSIVIEKEIALIMFPWIKQREYPVLHISETGSNTVGISLLNHKELRALNWIIPLTITTQFLANFNTSTTVGSPKIIWFKTLANEPHFAYHYLEIKNGWIIANIQQMGYFRVQYDNKNWQKLSSYLDSDQYTTIHVLNRAQIIDDAFYFLKTKQFNLYLYLQLVEYLWREGDYIVWFPMFKAFEYMSRFFPIPESTFLKEKMASILDKFYIDNPNIDFNHPLSKTLMVEITKWRCVFGSSQCMTLANKILIDRLQFPNRIKPQWKEWTYCAGLMMANNITWNQVFNMCINENRSDLFKYLSCSKDPLIIIDYIEKLSSSQKVGDYDRINAFHSIVTRHARNDMVLKYLLEHLRMIKPKKINMSVALADIINHVYSKEQLDKIKEYAKDNINSEEVESFIKNEYSHYNIKKATTNVYILEDTVVKNVMLDCITQYIETKIYFVNQKIILRSKEIDEQWNRN